MNKIKVAVLCSGGGTNFQAILNAAEAGLIPHGEISLLICDHEGAHCLTRAARYGIESVVFDRGKLSSAEREEKILQTLQDHKIGLVVLAGFMTILSKNFVQQLEGRIINVHPALLPSFGGKGMYGLHVHEAVLKAGVKVTGATVHFVSEECDGGKIISQRAVCVKEGDTPEMLQKRVMREAEWIILPEAAEEICKKLSEKETWK